MTQTGRQDRAASGRAETVSRRGAAGRVARDTVLRSGMVWLLVILVIVAQLVYPGFLAWGNVKNLLGQHSQVAIVAMGMTFVMIAGGFDLSVGATYAGASVFFAQFAGDVPIPLAFALVVAIGMGAGSINGLLVTRMKVNPFVATLGTASVFGGSAFLYSRSAPVLNYEPGFDWLGQGEFAGLPASVWLAVLLYALGGMGLAWTVYGRSLYAIGGSYEAARLSGLRVDLLRASTYVLVGGCAAIGGCIIASRLSVGQADVGANIALQAIAAVVIGGTSLFGGEGAVWRTAVGLLIIAVITNLSQSKGFDINVESVITGVIIVAAVGLDAYGRSRRG